MNCYYVGYFDASALEYGEIRETRFPDEERHIFSSKKKAREYVEKALTYYKEGGATIVKDDHNPNDPNECWWVTNGDEKLYIVIECTFIQ